MPSEPAPAAAVHHLHPLSLLFTLGNAAWRLLVPALLFFVFARGRAAEIWIALFFGPAALHAIFKYLTFRYRFDADELVVRQGLVFRSERHVPYGRIQSVDLVQNPLHRMLGVAEVRVQTASGDEAEATFKVLSLAAVEAMRERVARPGAGPAGAAAGEEPVRRRIASMPLGEIALFGLISNRGMVIVAAVFGLWWQLTSNGDRFEPPIDPSAVERLTEGVGGALAPIAFASILAALLVAVRLLSVVHAFVTLHGFVLEEVEGDLRVSAGLFTRVAATIPRRRIQTLTLRETPLHRLFRRVSVRAQTAGGHAGEREDVHREDWLVPLVRKDRVAALLREVQPELDLDGLDWRPIHPRAWGRLFRRRSLIALAIAAGLVPALGPVAASALGLIPWFAVTARLDARSRRWALAPSGVVVREGWWTRTTTAARYGKVQSIVLRENPFDRRAGMASLVVDTAGGRRASGGIRVPYLPRDVAGAARADVEAAVAAAPFRW